MSASGVKFISMGFTSSQKQEIVCNSHLCFGGDIFFFGATFKGAFIKIQRFNVV